MEFLTTSNMKKLYKQSKSQSGKTIFYNLEMLESLPELQEVDETTREAIFLQIYRQTTCINDLCLIDFFAGNKHIYIDIDFNISRIDNPEKILYFVYDINALRIKIFDCNAGYHAAPVKAYSVGRFSQTFKQINHIEIA